MYNEPEHNELRIGASILPQKHLYVVLMHLVYNVLLLYLLSILLLYIMYMVMYMHIIML